MALDFPLNPVNNQVYDNFIYNSTLGAWKVNWSLPTQLGTVTLGTWNASPIAIAYGGTGATDVATARANLGLAGLSGTQTFTGLQTFTSASTSTTPVVIKALSGQAADLLQITDNLNNIVAKFTNGGDFAEYNRVSVGSLTPIASTWLSVQPRFSGEVGQVIRGASGQTGNLQEWRNNVDTILSRVDASGNIYAPNINGTLVGNVSGTNVGKAGDVPFITLSNQTSWSNLPVGFGGMLNLSSTGLPVSNYQFFHKVANRDTAGGWGGVSIDYNTGALFVGTAIDNTVYATWKKLAFQSEAQTFTGQQTLSLITPAGTTTVAPIDLTPGTNLTTPLAGAIEYDGTVITATPNTSVGRAAVATPIFTSGVGTSGIAAATNYALFPAANDTITLPVGTYLVQLNFTLTVATSTTSTALNLNISGAGGAAGTFTWIGNGAIISAGTPTQYSQNAVALGTAFTVAPASAVAGRVYTVTGSGILRVTTAGTITPAYQFPTSPASGVVTLYAQNHMVITPLSSSGTAASTGAWA